MRCGLAMDAFGILVLAQPFKARLAKLVVLRPFAVGDLGDEIWFDKMHALGTTGVVFERVPLDLELTEPISQIDQHLRIEAGSNFARIVKILAVLVVITDEQSAESESRTLRIGKSADDEFLSAGAFDLEPRAAAIAGV